MNLGFIIAIDPGPTTGVCVMVYTGGREYTLIASYLIPWNHRYVMIDALFNYDPISALIYEKFRLFPDKAIGQAYSEFEAVQVSEILCTAAWYYRKQHLLIDLPPSVKGSNKPGGLKVQVRDTDKMMIKKSADNQTDREHTTDAYQLARWWILQQLKVMKV